MDLAYLVRLYRRRPPAIDTGSPYLELRGGTVGCGWAAGERRACYT